MTAAATPTRAGALRRMSADARRQQLLDTACRLVAEQGIEAVTMERLAETAGVSKALVYLHFDNSSEVLLELMRAETAALDEATRQLLEGAENFHEKLRALTGPILSALERPGSLARVFIIERSNRDLVEQWRAERQRGLIEFLAQVTLVSFPMPRADAELVAATLIGAFEAAAAHAWSVSGGIDRVQIERVLHALIEGGLGNVSEAAPGEAQRPRREDGRLRSRRVGRSRDLG